MSNRDLYRIFIIIMILAIIKFVYMGDYASAAVIIAALVPLIQDLRHKEATDGR